MRVEATLRCTTVSTQTVTPVTLDDKKNVPLVNIPVANSISVGVGDSCIWESNISMAAIITQVARFCGEVPASNQNKAILEAYDVARW